MRLEMADFPVKDVQLSDRTSYSNGILKIDKKELLELILEDSKIVSADLDIAFPGEQTRITFVRDIVEPRIKVLGPGCVFSGILGTPETAGQGKTNKLSGVAVTVSAQYEATLMSGTEAANAGLVDMWGEAAQLAPYGSLINIVPVIKLIDGISELNAHSTIQMVELKLARRLAETTLKLTPKNVEVFELSEVDPSLPRVVYNICYCTDQSGPHSHLSLYGLPVREGLPVYLHPNEFLDGAITVDARCGGGVAHWQTWAWMNEPMVLSLLRQHGKQLNFIGVILQRTSFSTEVAKQATAAVTSQLASLLRADGAIITGIPFIGNTFFGMMLTLQAYERKGIKTVLLTPERSSSGGAPLIFCVPEATAIVSSGDLLRRIEMAVPSKVIGCEKGQLMSETPEEPPFDPWGEIKSEGYSGLSGAVDTWGGMNYTVKEY